LGEGVVLGEDGSGEIDEELEFAFAIAIGEELGESEDRLVVELGPLQSYSRFTSSL
jgi:hypothetical protein